MGSRYLRLVVNVYSCIDVRFLRLSNIRRVINVFFWAKNFYIVYFDHSMMFYRYDFERKRTSILLWLKILWINIIDCPIYKLKYFRKSFMSLSLKFIDVFVLPFCVSLLTVTRWTNLLLDGLPTPNCPHCNKIFRGHQSNISGTITSRMILFPDLN